MTLSVAELIVVRHGQSLANVAFAAEAAGAAEVDLERLGPDADIALSEAGRKQAEDVGGWLAGLEPGRRPEVVICSPYLRARQTWRAAATAAATAATVATSVGDLPEPALDSRLVDRRMGAWELMPPATVATRFPDEYDQLGRVGLFHHRPPGGESFADVANRVRDFLRDWNLRTAGRRVLVVAHDSTVLMLRHLIEGISEEDLTPMLATPVVANGSITRFAGGGRDGGLRLVEFNAVGHLQQGHNIWENEHGQRLTTTPGPA